MSIPAKAEKVVQKERMYSSIWASIKALPVGQTLKVRTRTDNVPRLTQAVKKEKNRDVGVKRKVGMLTAGPLVITHNPEVKKGPEGQAYVTEYSIVEFKLSWDGSKL